MTELEWQNLQSGKDLIISEFNRTVVLEIKELHLIDETTIPEEDVRNLLSVLENFLVEQMPDKKKAWKWIYLACIYLTFIEGRPMHPIQLLQIRVKTDAGKKIYYCPAKNNNPNTTCYYCVCQKEKVKRVD